MTASDARLDTALQNRDSVAAGDIRSRRAVPSGSSGRFERLDAVLLLGVYMLAPLLLFGFVAAFVLFLLGEPIFRERGVTVSNLFVGDYVADHHDAFLAEVGAWVASGEVRYREDIREGLETVPAAFAEMLKGGNFGKMLVRVGEDPTL